MTVTPERVRELLGAATPGPWETRTFCSGSSVTPAGSSAKFGVTGIIVRDPDAALIAAAPDIAKAYLDLVTAVREFADGIADRIDWSDGRSNYGDNDAYAECARDLRDLLGAES